MQTVTDSIKRLGRALGVDLRRLHNVPSLTFLGLRNDPPELVLDVGANDGGFARLALKAFPSSRVHCFEPLQQPREALQAWLRRERIERVQVWPFALGECEEIARMHEHIEHSASSSLLATTPLNHEKFPQVSRQRTVEVSVTTLDRWMERESIGVPARSLLKLDVQGFELSVLRGAPRLLQYIGACITEVSVVPLYDGQASFRELVNLLGDAGLHYIGNLEQMHERSGRPLFIDAVFVRADRGAGRPGG
jgi:FkbM family methyltransferase